MKQISFLLALIFTCLQCTKEYTTDSDSFEIDGRIKEVKNGTVYLFHEENGDNEVIDSVNLNDTEYFSFKKKINHPDVYWIQLKGNIPMAVFLEPGKAIKFRTHIDSIESYKAAGVATQGSLKQLIKYISARDKDYQKYVSDFNRSKSLNDSYGMEQAAKKMNYNREARSSIVLNYCMKNNNTQVTPYAALHFMENIQTNWYDSIYTNLTDSIKTTYFGKELKQYITSLKSTKIGAKISTKTLVDLNNKEYTIPNSLKTTVLYFWKTSNLQSRTDALLLNASVYKDDVQVLLVNLDTDEKKIKQLPEYKKFTFPIIFNSKGIKAPIARDLGAKEVPSSIVIDKNGIITHMGLTVADIDKLYKK